MSDFKVIMHQIQFRWDSAQTLLGSLQRSPDLCGFKGSTSKRGEGKNGGDRVEGDKGKDGRRGDPKG